MRVGWVLAACKVHLQEREFVFQVNSVTGKFLQSSTSPTFSGLPGRSHEHSLARGVGEAGVTYSAKECSCVETVVCQQSLQTLSLFLAAALPSFSLVSVCTLCTCCFGVGFVVVVVFFFTSSCYYFQSLFTGCCLFCLSQRTLRS